MSSPIDTIRKMLLAHQADDGAAFRHAVEELIGEERRKNHHIVAKELERLLDGGGEVRRLRPFRTLHAWENEIPKDGDRGLPLLHVIDPRRELDELTLDDTVRSELDRFVREVSRGELLRAHGVAPPTRMLLCGPPGCGKTSAAEAVARALLLPLAVVRFDVVISSYLGETAANLRKIFDFIGTRPMVVLFDEFDAIAKHRDDDFEHGELKRVVNAFLQLMDGARGDNVLIAATNHQGMLDSAVWRRFDDILFLGLPNEDQRLQVFLSSLRSLTIDGLPPWREVAGMTAGMSHADIERISKMAIREAVLAGDDALRPDSIVSAVARYQARMSVIRTAGAQPVDSAGLGVGATHATPEGQPTPPPSRDAEGGSNDASTQAPAAAGGAKGTRARASRPVRPRSRKTGGEAGDGDEKQGAGGGG
tara:strand:- start:9 stop:1271 length:1263 start_codon:yes stop_codon:yes gene_type:complete